MQSHYFDKNGNIIDYYTIFNIPYTAQIDEIKSAFRALIKRYHPDTSKICSDTVIEKIDIIIRGYRILADEVSRNDYNTFLFYNKRTIENSLIIPNKRIKYSASLNDMIKAELFPKEIKRKDIIQNFGQDIEIFITAAEAVNGAVAYIQLPARMLCPICSGRNTECYVCNGIGRIHTTSQLEVKIPPNIGDNTIIDVDLAKIKPDRYTTFRAKSIRIRITIIKHKK